MVVAAGLGAHRHAGGWLKGLPWDSTVAPLAPFLHSLCCCWHCPAWHGAPGAFAVEMGMEDQAGGGAGQNGTSCSGQHRPPAPGHKNAPTTEGHERALPLGLQQDGLLAPCCPDPARCLTATCSPATARASSAPSSACWSPRSC